MFSKISFDIRKGQLHYNEIINSINAGLREIHLLAEMCNDSMQTLFFFLLLTSGITQLISVVALIRPDPLPFLVIMFFIAVALQSILINTVLYGFAGDVHETSKRSLQKLKQGVENMYLRNVRKERTYFRCSLASFQTTKIRFVMSNFIGKCTPPIFQIFCIDRIIDVLLSSRYKRLQ